MKDIIRAACGSPSSAEVHRATANIRRIAESCLMQGAAQVESALLNGMVTMTSIMTPNSVDDTVVATAAPQPEDASPPKGEAEDQPEDEVTIVDVEETSEGTKSKKYASYAAKKTVAQGMMDIALITSNANQLRYLLEYGQKTASFYFAVSFITISLMLQVAVGISLIFKGKLDLKGEAKMVHANKINNYVVVGVFLITIINVFVAAFSVPGESAKAVVAKVQTVNTAVSSARTN
ncbi:hypothetical protein PR048_008476 [Dryococelus australis]|uniref:Ninjurin-1 n=1 Tax=Dryococelus australis TaxID=614101 RepID=A0ABQ9HXI8_9NEOP|nr:hypothetical protein PR048_008476 [Dryococelus australis]